MRSDILAQMEKFMIWKDANTSTAALQLQRK